MGCNETPYNLCVAVSLFGYSASTALSADTQVPQASPTLDATILEEQAPSVYETQILPYAGDEERHDNYEKDYGSTSHDEASEYDVHHGDHADKKKAGLPQLNPKWYVSQIFWLAIMFFAMYLPFRFKVLPDLSSVIERRREQIEGDLIAARNLKQEAEDVHASYEKILKDAREEASALFIRAEDKIADMEKATFEGFHKKSVEQLAALEGELNAAKDKALLTIHDVAADVASQAAVKISGVDVTKDQVLTLLGSQEKGGSKGVA